MDVTHAGSVVPLGLEDVSYLVLVHPDLEATAQTVRSDPLDHQCVAGSLVIV